MLVLSRRLHEHILIGGAIQITVLDISRNGQVKLGIEAPREVSIVRSELLSSHIPLDTQRKTQPEINSCSTFDAPCVSQESGR